MANQISQETRANSIGFEKVKQFTDPYRRLDNRMDRSLLMREVEFVNKALENSSKPSTMLDLCCGVGEVSLMLQTRGFRTLGLDMNLLALTAFQQILQGEPLIQGDALHLPFGNGSLDIIVALHCFDLLDRVRFLQDCSRVLRSGGVLIFDALNSHSYKLILKRLQRYLIPLFPDTLNDKWINVFSFQDVLQIVSRVGLSLDSAFGYGWAPFSVNSNNKLVNAVDTVERILQLDHYPHISPRFVVVTRKNHVHQ